MVLYEKRKRETLFSIFSGKRHYHSFSELNVCMACLQMDLARSQLSLQSTKIRSYHCGVRLKFLVWYLLGIALNPILDAGGGGDANLLPPAGFLIQLRNR